MSTRDSPPTVGFVSMPFHGCTSPSMALGLLKAILGRAGIASTIYNFNLDFLKVALADPFTASEREIEYEYLPLPASGEWLFRPPGTPDEEERSALELAKCLGPGEELGPLLELRHKIDPFLEACVEKLLLGGHDILCFGVSNMQTRAALRVAEEVRRRDPGVRIVLGGASAFGVKGQALIQAFPVIDLLCHGEADLLIEPLVRALREEPGQPRLEELRGISFRREGVFSLGQDDGPQANLDELPPPDHGEWCAQVAAMVAARELNPRARLSLTFETARGCWWARKRQCGFCSLASPAFRAKSPDRVLEEVDTLVERHGLRALYCVDNNLAPEYFETLLPRLAERRYRFLWNVRPSLTRRQMAALARAGVVSVVAGVESLLTPTLRLMRKGTTGIRNIQGLKWFSELGIHPVWNYLSRVPGERADWLRQLERLIPRLMHLTPPLPSRIMVERDSPYHAHPAEHGIEILGPERQGALAFAELAPELVAGLSHCFECRIVGRDPEVDAIFEATIRPLLETWRASFASRGCTLSIVHGPVESLVIHGPFFAPERLLRVRGTLRSVLLACEGVRSEGSLAAELERGVGSETVPAALYAQLLSTLARDDAPVVGEGSLEETLAAAEADGLVVREGSKVLALPVNRTAYLERSASQRRLALLRLRRAFSPG